MSHVMKKKSKNAARHLLPHFLKKNYLLRSIEKLDQERKVQVLRDLVKTSPPTKVHVPLYRTYPYNGHHSFVRLNHGNTRMVSTLSIVVRPQTSRDS